MAQQSSGFDMSKLSTASKILLGGGLLLFIDTFLPWNRACADAGPFGSFCASVGGTHGLGILIMLLAIALVIWEALAVFGVDIPAPKTMVSAGLAGGIVVFTLLKILVDSEALYLFAWVGIILALGIAYGGWMRFQEGSVGGGSSAGGSSAPPPPSGGDSGGFTS
jgi:hypothetical protein